MLAVTQNPYRVLGLYSNTPSSEVSPSVERLRGMLANGVPATLPLGELLSSPVERTEASLTEAEQALSNPDGRLDAALFWFVDIEQRDAQAFTHLRSGHSDEAGKCWQVADDADNSWAATHNRIVLALSEEDWATFAALAPDYYAGPATSLLQVVDGATTNHAAAHRALPRTLVPRQLQGLPYTTTSHIPNRVANHGTAPARPTALQGRRGRTPPQGTTKKKSDRAAAASKCRRAETRRRACHIRRRFPLAQSGRGGRNRGALGSGCHVVADPWF